MKNLYIYCEGQTEESFINQVLFPYLLNNGVCAKPIVCTTKKTKNKKFKGGVRDYQKIKRELSILCKQHHHETVTTMFDYYGLPGNTPGVDMMSGNLYERVMRIEKAVETDINLPNLFFNLTVHEFEGLLFTNPSIFQTIADSRIVARLQTVRDGFDSPEHINNSIETAPSKRLGILIPGYSKVMNGTILSEQIGIDAMIAECSHFHEWVTKLRSLAD